MKIYTEIVLDWNGKEISRSSYEYDGEVVLCKGGKSAPAPAPAPAPEPVQKVQTKAVDESQTAARENQREKALRAKGIKSSILTQQEAVNSQSGKTLLGQ